MLNKKNISLAILFSLLSSTVNAEEIPQVFSETSRPTNFISGSSFVISNKLTKDVPNKTFVKSLQMKKHTSLKVKKSSSTLSDEFSHLSKNATLPKNIMSVLLEEKMPTAYRAIARDIYYSSFLKVEDKTERTQ